MLETHKARGNMRRGTILYFSQDGSIAHIWCEDLGNPLFSARQADFPELWQKLEVGTVVLFVGTGTEEGQGVVTLDLSVDAQG